MVQPARAGLNDAVEPAHSVRHSLHRILCSSTPPADSFLGRPDVTRQILSAFLWFARYPRRRRVWPISRPPRRLHSLVAAGHMVVSRVALSPSPVLLLASKLRRLLGALLGTACNGCKQQCARIGSEPILLHSVMSTDQRHVRARHHHHHPCSPSTQPPLIPPKVINPLFQPSNAVHMQSRDLPRVPAIAPLCQMR